MKQDIYTKDLRRRKQKSEEKLSKKYKYDKLQSRNQNIGTHHTFYNNFESLYLFSYQLRIVDDYTHNISLFAYFLKANVSLSSVFHS